MTNAQKIQFLQWLAQLIFHAKQTMTIERWTKWIQPDGLPITMWKPRTFVNNTMYGIDLDLNLGGKVIQLRCMEQNLTKTLDGKILTKYAILARRGHQIMWVIDRNGGFLGRIQDGKFHQSQDRATSPGQPSQPPQQTTGQATQDRELNEYWTSVETVSEEIPDIDTGIPEYVLRHYAEMEGPDE